MTWHLLLDYDSPAQLPGAVRPSVEAAYVVEPVSWPTAREIVAMRLSRAGYRITASSFERSTNGFHVKLELEPAPGSPMEIVALQAVCGSDPLRESCNVQRAREVEAMDVRCMASRLLAAVNRLLESPPNQPGGRSDHAGYALRLQYIIEAALEDGWPPDQAAADFFRDRWNTLYKPNPNRRAK